MGSNVEGRTQITASKLHGWFLWAVWSIFGLYMVFGLRYGRKYWHLSFFLHMFLGYFIILVTIAFSIVGIWKLQWMLVADFHNILGLIVFFGSVMLGVSGQIARYYNLEVRWQTKLSMRMAFIHKESHIQNT